MIQKYAISMYIQYKCTNMQHFETASERETHVAEIKR